MNRRIHFIINSLVYGGAERVFVDDAIFFANKGYSVTFFTLFAGGPLSNELEKHGVVVNQLNARTFYDFRALFLFRSELLKNDVVFSTLNESNVFARLAVLCMPSILLATREANVVDAKGWKYRILDWCVGFRSTHIICVSEAVRESLLKFMPWLCQRSVVIRNAVTVPAHKPEHPAGARLLTVGSLTPKKNHKMLLDAFALLPEKYTLTIVGVGILSEPLKQQALHLGIIDRLFFKGALTHEEVEREYCSHNLFVLPSLYEGCPNVVLESQAYALPTVAFNVSGVNEVVDGTSGVIVPEVNPVRLAEGIESAHSHSSTLSDGAYSKAVSEYGRAKRQEKLLNLLFKNKE